VLAQQLDAQLPQIRSLGALPDVADVGRLPGTGSGKAYSIPITPTEAVIDLQMYGYQLESLFPGGALHYPADSLHRLHVARAAAWMRRLSTVSKVPGADVDGRQLLAWAEVALRAEQDSAAQRLFDMRLAALTTSNAVGPGERSVTLERSLTLAAAVAALTGATDTGPHDPAWWARTFPLAEAYATQLLALPGHGYSTKSDSSSVLFRQFQAARELLAIAAIPEVELPPGTLKATVDRALIAVRRFPSRDWARQISRLPYRDVALALLSQPRGTELLAAFNAQLLAVATQGTEVAARREEIRASMASEFAVMARLGRTTVPPLAAHAWLNTPDSLYNATPRSHTFNDGVVRVLVFGDLNFDVFPALEEVHHYFSLRTDSKSGTRVQVLFMTETTGHSGSDVVSPADEVAWLKAFYVGKRGVTFPIAIWAGSKVAGDEGAMIPTPFPSKSAYGADLLGSTCIVIDGHGVVRTYVDMNTYNMRRKERSLIRTIETLLAESHA